MHPESSAICEEIGSRKSSKDYWAKRILGAIRKPGRILHQEVIGLVFRDQFLGLKQHLGKAIAADTRVADSPSQLTSQQI